MTWFRATPDTCRQAQSMTTTDGPAVDPSLTVTG